MSNAAMKPPFALLQPKVCPPRTDQVLVLDNPTLDDVNWIVMQRPDKNGVMALDFETRGDWAGPAAGPTTTYPVGASLADSRGSVYLNFRNNPAVYPALMGLLMDERVPLIAHNVFFDGGWALRDMPERGRLNWHACTLALYKLTATEGWIGQQWGLKKAQKDLLGWEETNESGLVEWLCLNGHTGGVSKIPKEGYWYNETTNRWVAPDKGEMWRAPTDILGYYSALDADACWLLYTEILLPCLKRFDLLCEYALEWYMPYTQVLIAQRLRGMLVDRKALETYQKELEGVIQAASAALLDSPLVKPHISAWNAAAVGRVAGAEPAKFKKSDTLRQEPARFTRAGTESASWLGWAAKRDRFERDGPALNKNWVKWAARLAAAGQDQHFNLGSGPQKAWLMYEALGFPITHYTKKDKPATDEDALKECGPVGAALNAIQEKEKIRQFCALILRNLDASDLLHASFAIPGTVTGRLSGREPNLQNQPKDLAYLACFKARPGMVWVTCDVVSLENYVLAELSRDDALDRLYGPTARPGQDAYLFNASQLPVIGPPIRATGYDPDTATAEDTARAKKACKKERTVGKVITLSANYGAGPPKIQASIRANGVELTLSDVEELHEGFWRLYGGIKKWERLLKAQWKRNKGWILNGIGRPLGVDERKLKDLVNSVCQSTGHDCLVYMINWSFARFKELGIHAEPVLADLHDAIFVECPEADAAAVQYVLETEAYEALNTWLGWDIKLRGAAKVCRTWKDDKIGD